MLRHPHVACGHENLALGSQFPINALNDYAHTHGLRLRHFMHRLGWAAPLTSLLKDVAPRENHHQDCGHNQKRQLSLRTIVLFTLHCHGRSPPKEISSVSLFWLGNRYDHAAPRAASRTLIKLRQHGQV
jgi:hypothetical protein